MLFVMQNIFSECKAKGSKKSLRAIALKKTSKNR